jgi:hypothetical protein
MEAMTVRVREIIGNAGGVTFAATVTAASRERFRGQPVVRIRISLRIAVRAGESSRDTRERVRHEALRFLDIA